MLDKVSVAFLIRLSIVCGRPNLALGSALVRQTKQLQQKASHLKTRINQ